MSPSQTTDPTLTESNVLLIVFPGFNTIDMNGPYDVLTKSGMNKMFNLTVASETLITRSCEGVKVEVSVFCTYHLLAGAHKPSQSGM